VTCSLQVEHAAQYDTSNPNVRILVEEAREAHWKLTADKGFKTLKVGRCILHLSVGYLSMSAFLSRSTPYAGSNEPQYAASTQACLSPNAAAAVAAAAASCRAFLSCSSCWPTQQQTWCTMRQQSELVTVPQSRSCQAPQVHLFIWACIG
jgi:hypothetical protein